MLAALLILAITASGLQALIDNSPENMGSVLWVLASTLSILLYIGCTEALEKQPLSTLCILGICITTQLGALLAQTAAWTPLRASLYDPVLTFSTLAIYQGVAILAHVAYCYFSFSKPPEKRLLRSSLAWLGFYRTPSSRALWIMGCFGLVSFFLTGSSGITSKIGHAFDFLAWAPFLIAVYRYQIGAPYCGNLKLYLVLLAVFSLLIVVVCMAFNIRQQMFFGFATVSLVYMLSGLRSNAHLNWKSVMKLMVLASVAVAIGGPLSDLATAMAVARANRGKVPATEMIATTIDVWGRPYLLEAYRAQDKEMLSSNRYDESYIANPLIARYVVTKFHDNALHFGGLINSSNIDEFARFSRDALWAVLPEPLLRVLGVNLTKENVPNSVGDYLTYLTIGMPLGGNRPGSILAQGRTLFGVAFPFIYALICLLLYWFMDLLTIRSSFEKTSLSAVGMMRIWELYSTDMLPDGFQGVAYLIVREIPQMTAIYCLLVWLCSALLGENEHAKNEFRTYGGY
jgi:hypothetical protein